MINELVEALAAIEHDRWAHWQRYLHQQCEQLSDGGLKIPKELVQRWQKQIETPYAQLSEAEKQSDRDQVRKVLPVVENFFAVKE